MVMRRDHVSYLFREHFGGEPEVWVRAPGRVDLMGSHTDYNLGLVLTMAISRDTWIAARSNRTRRVRIHAADIGSDDSFCLDEIQRNEQASWSNYVRGVAAVLASNGLMLNGFDGVIHSTVPLESGLSSSAALECAVAVAFRELAGWSMDPRRMALLCQCAENEFVGVKCGILDQFSSCLGEKGCALLLDCRDLSTRPVPIASGIHVMVCDTRSPRQLAGGKYADRRQQCEEAAARLGVRALGEVRPATLQAHSAEWPEGVRKRSRFIVEENDRVRDLAGALSTGNRDQVHELTRASFDGARDLFEICSPSMKAMMDAMLAAPGCIGARQAGAGFGGCMVAFVEHECVAAFGDQVRLLYRSATGITPAIFPVAASAGAGLLEAPAVTA